jgi:hypothetical protein
VIVSYIDDHRKEFGVEPICAVLSEHGIPIAPNTYHVRKKAPISDSDLADAYLVNAVIDLWRKTRSCTESGRCGGRCAAPAFWSAGTRSVG